MKTISGEIRGIWNLGTREQDRPLVVAECWMSLHDGLRLPDIGTRHDQDEILVQSCILLRESDIAFAYIMLFLGQALVESVSAHSHNHRVRWRLHAGDGRGHRHRNRQLEPFAIREDGGTHRLHVRLLPVPRSYVGGQYKPKAVHLAVVFELGHESDLHLHLRTGGYGANLGCPNIRTPLHHQRRSISLCLSALINLSCSVFVLDLS
ncbi:hypothetical protein Mapa_003108 [Marchantia paleacea]|nr:hypothetical protein Mapa_003108 [Marchantia paleacea]